MLVTALPPSESINTEITVTPKLKFGKREQKLVFLQVRGLRACPYGHSSTSGSTWGGRKLYPRMVILSSYHVRTQACAGSAGCPGSPSSGQAASVALRAAHAVARDVSAGHTAHIDSYQ